MPVMAKRRRWEGIMGGNRIEDTCSCFPLEMDQIPYMTQLSCNPAPVGGENG